MKKFYEIREFDDGSTTWSKGFYATRKLAEDVVKIKYPGSNSNYVSIVEYEMFTEQDKVQELEDASLIKTLTAAQLGAIQRNLDTFKK